MFCKPRREKVCVENDGAPQSAASRQEVCLGLPCLAPAAPAARRAAAVLPAWHKHSKRSAAESHLACNGLQLAQLRRQLKVSAANNLSDIAKG